jgi:hypothetical protein
VPASKDFEAKIIDFFRYMRESSEGERLIVKINSHVNERKVYDDFAKIYREYKAVRRQLTSDYFSRKPRTWLKNCVTILSLQYVKLTERAHEA